MRAKIVTVISILVVTIGLIALIQLNTSTDAPVQGLTADPVRGDAAATVMIEEYSDFQCPACKQFYPTLKQILQEFPGQVKLVYNDFPLRTIHPNGAAAAEAGQCAFAQDAFWEYHDLLFQRQSVWSPELELDPIFTGYAVELGLDEATFSACLASDSTVASITEDEAEANQASVNSTPTIFVNGERMIGPSYDDLRAKVAEQLGQ